MAKQSGLGDALWIGGVDVSGDTGSIGNVGGGPAPLDLTGIDKSAVERVGGIRDGRIEWSSWFNPTVAHPTLSALPTTDITVTYCRGTALADPAACLVAKQLNYDGSRASDGSFTLAIGAAANGYGVEWGVLGTPGKRTDTAATNGAAVDGTAASSFGLQAYLHVFALVGTDITVKLQESSDSGGADAWADVVGGGFTQVLAAGFVPQAQRIATSATLPVERYLRVVSTTAGGVTSCTFAVVIVRNATAVVF